MTRVNLFVFATPVFLISKSTTTSATRVMQTSITAIMINRCRESDVFSGVGAPSPLFDSAAQQQNAYHPEHLHTKVRIISCINCKTA